MVLIKFSSALNDVTGTRTTSIELEKTTIKKLFEKLITEYGKEFETRLMEGGEIRRFVNVYVNGEDIRHLSGIDTKITDRDEVSVLPAISGG
ncbi:ubiquitin-like small modifier protein 1 [Methanolobus sediminis]|uniref:Ubiquitin-like small modifier protein 1 n=1 Tax=Methanolobus sediminis TaxID=3072978 RepID=A0AA51UKY0_9EURY|nr:ubiquitin-like small modifier protein 1 [Methanolobus sediminis]WMW25290.1 ubiquitin-like small modifier protein 1 [Methanolobus sediminis]